MRLTLFLSLPLPPFRPPILSLFLPAAPFILSFSPSQPPFLLSRSKSNSRRVELTGRGTAPTEIDFGKTKRARGPCLCKGERCDTDYGPAELPSDLLCMYREGSLFLRRRRSRLVSSSSSLASSAPVIGGRAKARHHVPCTAISWFSSDLSKIGIIEIH